MRELDCLIGLNLISELSPFQQNILLREFSSPLDIFGASVERLKKIGVKENVAKKILLLDDKIVEEEIERAQEQGLRIIALYDKDYPSRLKQIADPPLVLYVKGVLPNYDDLTLAIVGSRQASYYGLAMARQFSSYLGKIGFWIVSGMARGIDTYAHKGALEIKAKTIAVMGSGFNYLYPPENKNLAEEISRNGAVISEFPLNTPPLKKNFPRRNRLISGLSLGVLVVEAAQNSGALITVDFALEQNREVFCLPGKVDSVTSRGTNKLIQQGAKLVLEPEDIIEELGLNLKK